MTTKHRSLILLAFLLLLTEIRPVFAQSQLEQALNDMYRICLFANRENNPFSTAVTLATEYLGPGLSDFIESNVASIPLSSTPPGLMPVQVEGRTVPQVVNFTPIFTETSATVGRGNLYVGSSFSYFNMSMLRGNALNELEFNFAQNPGGSDVIFAHMPLGIDVYALTLYATFGVTERFDLGMAFPVVQLDVSGRRTTFIIRGDDNPDLRYGGFSRRADYSFTGVPTVVLPGREPGEAAGDPAGVASSETFLGAMAVRAKYQFPVSAESASSVAAMADVRVPVGRNDENTLGAGNLGGRLLLITEYDVGSFRPHMNVGAEYWGGDGNSSLLYSAGFNQRLGPELFFTFDLLGTLDLESEEELNRIDELNLQFTADGQLVPLSNIEALDRDHTLNASLGLRLVFSPRFHLYGASLFSLVDSALHSLATPTIGGALSF